MYNKFMVGDIVAYKEVAYEVVDFMAVGSDYEFVYDLKEVDGDGEYLDRHENELSLVKAVDGRDKDEQLFIVRVTNTNNATGDFDAYNAPFVFKTTESAWKWIDEEMEKNKQIATECLSADEIDELVSYEKLDMDSILDVDGRQFRFEILNVAMKE